MIKQYAVLGLGNFGRSLAINLQKLGSEVAVVDKNAEKIHEIADSVAYAMCADIGDPEVIQNLGARNLDGVIVAVAQDMEASVMSTLISKELGVPLVIAKAKNLMHAQILKKIGADEVVFPELEMGEHVARNLSALNLAEWMMISDDYSLVELRVPKEWVGKTLRELEVQKIENISVVGFEQDGEINVNLDQDLPITEGIKIIMVGENVAIEQFQKE